MTTRELEQAVAEELKQIAPDIEFTDVDLEADLREEFDIDSMDFLRLVSALCTRLNISIPESDYPNILTFNKMSRYLEEKTVRV